jgi:hypothetical protein
VDSRRVGAGGVGRVEDQPASFLDVEVVQLGDAAEQLLDLVHGGTPGA